MSQERVSYKVAKALKEAGYPQEYKGYRYTTKKCRGRYMDNPGNNAWYEFDEGELVDGNMYQLFQSSSAYAPTYIDAWLWLWREKNIQIVAEPRTMIYCYIKSSFYGLPLELTHSFNDAEDAIIAGINHLVENDLIK